MRLKWNHNANNSKPGKKRKVGMKVEYTENNQQVEWILIKSHIQLHI